MTSPTRIQRKRTRGWRMPEGCVSVVRPSRWGNPYIVVPCATPVYRGQFAVVRDDELMDWPNSLEISQELAVKRFRRDLEDGLLAFTVDEVRRELRGKTLACWCPLPAPGEPDLCHAAVLLAVAAGARQ